MRGSRARAPAAATPTAVCKLAPPTWNTTAAHKAPKESATSVRLAKDTASAAGIWPTVVA
jgi:hypothetical protein